MSVVIETTVGDVTVDLFVVERPQTCLNFLKLCKMKYYNLCLFHTVNANFCAQTGDPTGKGDGGESIHGLLKGRDYRLYQGETQPKIKHDSPGLISMVSHGNGMLGSQFIFTLSPDLGSLDGEHCVFGKVVEGSEVLLKLNETIADENHRPYQDIRVTHTVVLEDPFQDPDGMITPPPSPTPPSTKDVAYSRIPADEALSESHTQEELTEMVQAREAAARATILEMVGDLPDADVAPPENVLFVCKLNPVTSDHDLSLIFSRFGKVNSCEVIRDAVSGESLQYAFVEFDDKKSCEEAYLKMDNVLIDERRIHVDFSQSVAKWRGKGRGVEMLVPVPAGGWGAKNNRKRNFPPRNEPPHESRHNRAERYKEKEDDRKHARSDRRNGESAKNNRQDREERYEKYHDRRKPEIKNGESSKNRNSDRNGEGKKNKVSAKKGKEISKKKRRPTPSSSSSSETSSSSSSSDSSGSEPVRKKSRSRKADKVLVVVRAPRGKRPKKSRKTSKKSRKHDSESDSDRVKRKKRRRKRDSSSSSDESIVMKKKKKRNSSEKSEKKKRIEKKKPPSSDSSSEDSSEEEVPKKKGKKRRNSTLSDTESESEKRRKNSKKATKKPVTSSSSDDFSVTDSD